LIVARNGEEAWKLLEAAADLQSPPPDLILLDLNLPRFDGEQILTRLREERTFDGPEALLRQVRDDIGRARRMLDIVDPEPAA